MLHTQSDQWLIPVTRHEQFSWWSTFSTKEGRQTDWTFIHTRHLVWWLIGKLFISRVLCECYVPACVHVPACSFYYHYRWYMRTLVTGKEQDDSSPLLLLPWLFLFSSFFYSSMQNQYVSVSQRIAFTFFLVSFNSSNTLLFFWTGYSDSELSSPVIL